MGLFSSLIGAAAPFVGNLIAPGIGGVIGSALGGAIASGGGGGGGGSQPAGTTTQTQQFTMDPRMQAILYGDGTSGNGGILGQAAGLANQPRSPGLSAFGSSTDDYLHNWGIPTFNSSQQAAQNLQAGALTAPQMQAAQASPNIQLSAAHVNAPAQNYMNLSGSYDRFINGDAGANPYLTGALKSAVDLTNTSYAKNQANLTDTLQRSVLPGIRSNAVLAGQYGGSRQGIAEGNALSDYTKQLSNNNLALAQTNSANTTGAQAQSYNQGQDRALAATQGLGAQQYGVAAQDAGAQQAMLSQNSAQQQQANLANAGYAQNAGQNNQQAQQQTNQLNSANQATGIGLSSGLLGQAYNYANANQNAPTSQLSQVSSILAPYTGLGGSSATTSPYFTNPTGNLIGGATAGLGLYNAYQNATNNGGLAAGQAALPAWSASQAGYLDPTYVGP